MAETSTPGPGDRRYPQEGQPCGTELPPALTEKLAAIERTGDLEERASTAAGSPTSTFWAIHDFNAAGRFVQHIPLPSEIVNSASQIAVSITELNSQGQPFLGDAVMEVFNVVPKADNTLLVRGHVHFDRALPVRLNLVIVN